MKHTENWLEWAVELQSLAQAGLAYVRDDFDRERYTRIREISAEILAHKSDIPVEKVKDLFCDEIGYPTPKLDTRAAIFREGKILLVQERNGTWALPGGWVEMRTSVEENVIKEALEEAGLAVTADTVIAIQDRAKHNPPVYAHSITVVFVLCTLQGGHFVENIETTSSAWFTMADLPPLALEKNTPEQIRMCFDAREAKHWKTLFD